MENQTTVTPAPAAQKPPALAPEPKTVLDPVAQFIGRYLECTEHQRNVLALWVLHTHCFSAAQFTPYLSIYSEKKQSGKTLCLQLLSLFTPNPAFSTGVTAATLSKRTDLAELPTFLLDEAQVTLGTRSRSKNPTLRAMLVSGFQRGIGYSDSKRERNLFAPKAFAGIGTLPEPLADRSLPIILDPLNGASRVDRFHLARAQEEAKPLLEQLRNWAQEHLPALKAAKGYSWGQLPPNLTPRRNDMIEPLLQLADALGGLWPTRARQSITGIFDYQLAHENKLELKLLDDIREAFVHYGRPGKLATAALLAYLRNLPAPGIRKAPSPSTPSRPCSGPSAFTAGRNESRNQRNSPLPIAAIPPRTLSRSGPACCRRRPSSTMTPVCATTVTPARKRRLRRGWRKPTGRNWSWPTARPGKRPKPMPGLRTRPLRGQKPAPKQARTPVLMRVVAV